MSDEPQGTNEETQSSGIRQKAVEAYDGARESIADTGRRAGDAISEAPLAVLAGGLAAGAVIGALLPRTRAEARVLGPVGEKVTGRARDAAQAAREAGVQRLKELGLTPDAGADALRDIVEGAGDAAKTSAQAAFGRIRGE